jgi:hypothetical protein
VAAHLHNYPRHTQDLIIELFARNSGIKLNQGTYISKSHQHYNEIVRHAMSVHKAASEGFKDVLIMIIGCIWDCWIAANEVGVRC